MSFYKSQALGPIFDAHEWELDNTFVPRALLPFWFRVLFFWRIRRELVLSVEVNLEVNDRHFTVGAEDALLLFAGVYSDGTTLSAIPLNIRVMRLTWA